MGRVTTGAYQATGKKMEGTNAQANFSKPPKMGKVSATEPLPAAMNPKPFDRAIMPGVGGVRSGGISRQAPTIAPVAGHTFMPHKVNP